MRQAGTVDGEPFLSDVSTQRHTLPVAYLFLRMPARHRTFYPPRYTYYLPPAPQYHVTHTIFRRLTTTMPACLLPLQRRR